MEDIILILGKGRNFQDFCAICEELGIAFIVADSAHNFDSQLKDASIVVHFLENSSYNQLFNITGERKGSRLWLLECLDESVTITAGNLSIPENYLGFCLSDLFPEKRFVELITDELTTREAIAQADIFFQKLQFATAISRDSAGRIVSRVVYSMINEAIYVNMYGLAEMEDIDQMMRLGANFPMGPFEYADTLGLDRILRTLEWMTVELGPQYRPCPVLRRKVEAGLLGKKTGRGFYNY